MKHSRLMQIGALTIVAGLIAGCSSSTDDASSSPGDTTVSEPVTITYNNFISNGGNEPNLDTIVAAFEKENPNITVDVTTLPYGDYFTALQTDLVAGTEADVFDIEFANYRSYVESGVAAPIEGVNASVYRAALAESYQTDGVQYALPTSFSTVVLYYNKDLFDAAGVAYPTADWTWEDEQAAAEAITDKSKDIWGDYQPFTYNEYYKAVAQAGGSFLSEDGSTVNFNTPEGIKAASWLVNKVGNTMPAAGDASTDSDADLFSTGKLAMWHTGIWMFNSMQEVPFGWDIVVEPGLTQQASHLFSNAVMVSANSDEVAAATKWAEFLTSSDTMVDVRLASSWELPPVADDAALSAYLTAGLPQNRQAVFDSLNGVAIAPSIGANQAQMADIVTKYLAEAAAGRMTVEEAVAQSADEVQPLLPTK